MNKIDLMDYVDNSWKIILTDDFKSKLKRKIRQQKISVKKISALTGKSIDGIWKFHQNKYNVNFTYLTKLCRELKINKNILHTNIKGIYVGVKKASFYTKSITVNGGFAAWWGAWIGEGDHSPTHESVSLTNYEINLIKMHIKMLQIFEFPLDRILVEVITNKQGNKDLVKQRWSDILNLPVEQITSVTFMEKATQEGARAQVWSAAFHRILHKIDYKVKEMIKESDENIKSEYIRGIFAAEGSVRRMEIRLGMKDENEINFMRGILKDLKIETKIPYANKTNSSYELSILGYDNIHNFIKIDGFKYHSKRKAKLERFFSYYEDKLPLHVRFERIQRTIQARGKLTNHELSRWINTSPRNVAQITRQLAQKGLLVVDRNEKELRYSLP